MLAVTLVLNAAVEWTRRQGGSPSLRALLYMDEVFGYLPPVANPPSKLPLLTLLKQARAAGVGVVLATQNPVDLDYKALSNTGTWFLGKLQTERDKSRVLDGLEGVVELVDARAAGQDAVRAAQPRVPDAQRGFEATGAMSSASGGGLGIGGAGGLGPRPPGPPATPGRGTREAHPAPASMRSHRKSRCCQRESPNTSCRRRLHQRHMSRCCTAALVHYTDSKRGIDVTAPVHAVTSVTDGALAVNWDDASIVDVAPDSLARPPRIQPPATGALPAAARNAKSYTKWTDDFEQWLVRAKPLRLYSAPTYKLSSRPGETEADFRPASSRRRARRRDAAVEKLRGKCAARVARATDKIRRTQESVAREQQQVSQQKTQTAVSLGATLLGALMGRKAVSMSTLGRATTTARGVGRSMKEAADVAQAQERQRAAEEELQAIEAELQGEVQDLVSGAPDVAIETIEVKPKRAGVEVRLVALVWKPLL